MSKWYVLFNGHGQGSRTTTGLGRVWVASRTLPGYKRLFSWRENIEGVAECMKEGDVITISGFSYGGFTANSLCILLMERGIEVDNLFLVDAVWRKRDMWASPWSLLDRWRIHVPTNVNHALSWRQKIGIIQGHQVVAHGSTFEERFLNVRHLYMDKQEDVYNTILKAHRLQGAM